MLELWKWADGNSIEIVHEIIRNIGRTENITKKEISSIGNLYDSFLGDTRNSRDTPNSPIEVCLAVFSIKHRRETESKNNSQFQELTTITAQTNFFIKTSVVSSYLVRFLKMKNHLVSKCNSLNIKINIDIFWILF